MNGEGDGKVTVRYDPDLATTRRERDDLRLELAKRESKEKDLIKRVRKLERRLNDVTGDDEKITKLRQQLLKKEKHIDGLQKYLRKLPTIDEYRNEFKCQSVHFLKIVFEPKSPNRAKVSLN